MNDPKCDEPVAFHARIIVGKGRLNRKCHVLLPLMPEPNPPDPNVLYLKAEAPVGNERHVVLGEFMDAWSNLESALSDLCGQILKTNFLTTHAIISSLGTRQTKDLLLWLGSINVRDKCAALETLMDRLSKQASKRNNLVHGHWSLEAIVHAENGEPRLETRWVREYTPADPDIDRKLQELKNKKERSKYCFTIQDINTVAQTVKILRKDISKFIDTLRQKN
jgi:hypothetical protein